MPTLTRPFAAHPARPLVSPDTSPALADRLIEEGLKSLTEIAAMLPPMREGKKVSTASVFRWIKKGKSGIKLEAIRLHGSGYWSSKPALARFASALTAREQGEG